MGKGLCGGQSTERSTESCNMDRSHEIREAVGWVNGQHGTEHKMVDIKGDFDVRRDVT